MLNALRHQRFGHVSGVASIGFHTPCSTPCGIRGLDTAIESGQFEAISKCSTPCGIRGLDTSLAASLAASLAGAQRLAASEVWTPPEFGQIRNQCRVLNALRHQRFGHPILPAHRTAPSQVLNALRHQRFGHILNLSAVICGGSAQRLAASEVWTLMFILYLLPLLSVLNALRHQRFGHCFHGCCFGFFRGAQRLAASEVWTLNVDERFSDFLHFVLNALRHQRFGHNGLPISTESIVRAQRLAASEVWTRHPAKDA